MSDKDDEKDAMMHKQGEIIMDLTMRITSLERLLLKKNIMTEEEVVSGINEAKKELMELVAKAIELQNKN